MTTQPAPIGLTLPRSHSNPIELHAERITTMPIPAAYLSIVLIWSTTPLAIQWSSEGIAFTSALLIRMAIALAVATLGLRLARIRFPFHSRARLAYLVGGCGIFGTLALTYWGAARHVNSGLISVLFGLSPLFATLFSALWLDERALTPKRILGALLGTAGLAVIFLHGHSHADQANIVGTLAVLGGVIVSAATLVILKRIGDDSPPLATTVGSVGVTLPLVALLWLGDGAPLPSHMAPRAAAAIAYLGVFGSVLGFSLYYYLVRHLHASQVALITLITPLAALLLGHGLNGEAVGLRLLLGSLLILTGLAVHQSEHWRPARLKVRHNSD